MATPVHYIRTIHTTFTAAHPHSSSAWANPSAVARTHTHANILLNFAGTYNSNIVNNNLPPMAKYPPGLPGTNNVVVGRKRSASIRGMPPSYAQRIQSQRVKFDPFAEDSDSVLYTSLHPPAPRSVVARPTTPIPYTIQIPPAAPADIQRHQQQQQQYRQHQQHQHHHRSQPVRARSPQPQYPKLAPQRVSTPAPPPVTPTPAATPTPTPAATVAAPVPNPAVAAKEREARSRIVAGILLNRVHAVGKPMRRRSPSADQPRPYVPSGLSTCIATDA